MKTLSIPVRLSIALATAPLAAPALADTYTSFSSASSSGFTTETDTVLGMFLKPTPPAGSTTTSYSVVSTASGYSSTGTLSFASTLTSYTFLWGSPDDYNTVTDDRLSFTGSSFSSGTGSNSESRLFTFVDPLGFNALTFRTTGIAFEVAMVAAVPEPETYALLLAGLGAIGLAARRRRRV